MKRPLLILIILSVTPIFGCMNNESDETQNRIQQQNIDFEPIHNQTSVNQQVSNEVKNILSEHDDITEISVINNHQDIVAAINVKPLSRFQLKKTEKKLKKKLSKHFPDNKITLSTDKKIMIELNRVERSMQKNNLSKEQLKRKISDIKKLSKEQT